MGEGWGQKPGVRRQTKHPRQDHGSFGGSRDGDTMDAWLCPGPWG